MVDVLDDREGHREDDPLLHADHDDDGSGDEGDGKLALANASDRGHAPVVDQPQADQEDDGGEDGVGHVGEGAGQEQQHGDHDRARGELRDLAAAAAAVDHLGLGGAAVHDERAADAGPDVRHAEAHEVHVLVVAVPVLHGIGPGRRRALGQDHDDDGTRLVPVSRATTLSPAMAHRGEAEARAGRPAPSRGP